MGLNAYILLLLDPGVGDWIAVALTSEMPIVASQFPERQLSSADEII
jgi:hypothetical protein